MSSEQERERYDAEDFDLESTVSDDQNDPNFDVLEEARSGISRLSLKKKSKILDDDMDSVEDPDEVDIVVPELDEEDKKSFETVQKIVEAGHLGKLKVDQCKVYLRKYGLRLAGKKDTLIERIKEHLEVVDGGGEKMYPASSFVLNCKGDACTGDIVMFEQNVYEMFSIVSRSATGPSCGTRIVAGRIVKESYGAAKQQHTFTIEVLWSKGEKPLPPLHPLLIKGRNLYRLKTLRQRWEDESERQKIVSEKHDRGFLARNEREIRMQEKELRKTLKKDRHPIKNQALATKNSTSDTVKPAMQQQVLQPLQMHQPQIPWQQAQIYHQIMSNNTGFPQALNIPHISSSSIPSTNMNYYPPQTRQYPPQTGQYPPLSSNWERQGHHHHHPSTNQWNHQGEMRGQPCRHYAKGRCTYGDRCKFSHA